MSASPYFYFSRGRRHAAHHAHGHRVAAGPELRRARQEIVGVPTTAGTFPMSTCSPPTASRPMPTPRTRSSSIRRRSRTKSFAPAIGLAGRRCRRCRSPSVDRWRDAPERVVHRYVSRGHDGHVARHDDAMRRHVRRAGHRSRSARRARPRRVMHDRTDVRADRRHGDAGQSHVAISRRPPGARRSYFVAAGSGASSSPARRRRSPVRRRRTRPSVTCISTRSPSSVRCPSASR